MRYSNGLDKFELVCAALAVMLVATALLVNASSDYRDVPSMSVDVLTTDSSVDIQPDTEPESEPDTELVTETEPATEPITEAPIQPPVDVDVFAFTEAMNGIEADYPDTVLAATSDGGMEYIDRIIFVGDSTTYGLWRYGVLSGGFSSKQVWTPASGTLTLSIASYATIVYPDDGSEITIAEAASRSLPEIMVITLGINGISFMREEQFKSSYGSLIEQIQEASPYTKIILQSMFPVARTYEKMTAINNERIATGNRWVAELAEKYGLKYANTASALIGEDEFLPHELQNGDGLHLNGDGYKLELAYLSSHMLPEYDAAAQETDAEVYDDTQPNEDIITEPADSDTQASPDTQAETETETVVETVAETVAVTEAETMPEMLP